MGLNWASLINQYRELCGWDTIVEHVFVNSVRKGREAYLIVRGIFHILLFVVLVHNNYWFVPHRQFCFLLQMVIYYACLPTFFYLFCGLFCNSASNVIFNKTFTPNKLLGCHCIHNQRTISLLCFTSLQAQMSGQH